MKRLRYALLSDGTSDKALMPILEWVLKTNSDCWLPDGEWVDDRVRHIDRGDLVGRIEYATTQYQCELLFLHRDSERIDIGERTREISLAVESARQKLGQLCPVVAVVPVRMTEAWLLLDELAIRKAAANPRGQMPLQLPRLRDVESMPDPKLTLHKLLREACGLHGRRLATFAPVQKAGLVPRFIDDFSPLRQLTAFQSLEQNVKSALEELGLVLP